VLHGVLKFYGDTSTPEKHWASLTKFIDNEYSRISSGGITKMFANFGDWVPPPPAKKVSTDYTSAFSFLNDLRNVVFMAQKLGHADDASRYQAILTNVSNMFHSQYFDSNSNSYADGGQTAQVLALKLGVVPDQYKQAVVSNLVQDIIAHGNHTSCGIIGWRFQCEVLSAMGHADLAYALMTQRTYPSYGFEIFHPFEPATTIWELWDGPSEGPGMNSRDHIMFGGPGYWLYSYVGGISQTKDSIGFEHAVFTPPADLLFQALKGVSPMHHSNTSAPLKWASVSKTVPRGEFGLSWQLLNPTGNTCAAATPEGTTAKFQCPGGIISSVVFASYGTSTGDCTDGFKPSSCNADLSEYVKQQCVGKSECSISCANNACGSFKVPDPCFGTPKHVSVQVVCTGAGNVQVKVTTNVPANSDAQTNLPTLGASPSQVNVTEGGKTIWSQGKYVPGVPGISAVTAAAGEESSPVTVVHGSGKFEFQIIVPV